MKKVIFKESYQVLLIVLGLITIGVYSTYSMFTAEARLNNVISLSASSLSINSDLIEYEEITVEPYSSTTIDVNVVNSSSSTLYYGIWYQMVVPSTKGSDVTIAKLNTSSYDPTGTVAASATKTVKIIIINYSSTSITTAIGVANSTTSNLNLSSGKTLITETSINGDLKFGISGSTGIPTSGYYTMTSTCSNVTYDNFTQKTKITDFTGKATCSLTFTTSTNYPLLYDTVQIGDYIAYVGNNGCKNNGTAVTGTGAAESGNSCLGYNANDTLDTQTGTYGYCYSANYKFYTYGWRVLYKENNSVYIVSAGSPQCIAGISSDPASNITNFDNASLKYCNTSYISGGTCPTSASDVVHAMDSGDFYKFTYQKYGTGNHLYNFDDTSYGGGNYTSSTNYCYIKYSTTGCGYSDDIIDNGGFYWFASAFSSSYTFLWTPGSRCESITNVSIMACGFRPVLKLDSTIKATGGAGTMTNPYTISTRTS